MKKSTIIGYSAGAVGAALLGALTLPIIAWFFSPEDIGRVSMLQVVSTFCVLLFSLGLDQAYVREYHETKNKSSLLRSTLTPSLIFFIFIFICTFLYDNQLISILMYNERSCWLSVLTISCFAFLLISRFLSLVLRMQERALTFSLSQILPKLTFILIVGGCVFFSFPTNLHILIGAQFASALSVLLFLFLNSRHELFRASQDCTSESIELNKLLYFGVPLVIGGLASWGLNVMDKLFLRFMSSLAELGVYSIAANIASGAGVLAGIFTTIWAPSVFKRSADGINPKRIEEISEHILAVVFFIFVAIGSTSWILPYLLPDAYHSVENLVVACVAAPLLYALSEATSIGISISRRTGLSMSASIIAMLVNLGGCYLLVPAWGAGGAAISTAFSFWVFMICRTELSRLVWHKSPRLKLYTSTSLCIGISIATVLFEAARDFSVVIWLFAGGLGLILFRPSTSVLISKVGYFKNDEQ